MKINLFYSIQIICMFKAINNHFIDRSKIEIPKNRPFYNLKSAKSLKKMEKYFQHQFWKIQHARNIKKITPNERRDQTHLLRIYFFVFFSECHRLKNLRRI